MFDGFRKEKLETIGATINLVMAGSGPPLLLLHGYPQTHVMWHKIAPRLAQDFTVVVPDLRGYGDSSKPDGGPDHAGYSKRAMAKDQLDVMRELGFERFFVAGHDRGGRVGHRMALDYADRVLKLSVLDIIPTHKVFASADKELATAYFHWFFLIQPEPFPETLIGASTEYYLRSRLTDWGASETFTEEAVAEYLRCFREPEAIHASCEDYRAGASLDLVHDEADLDRKVSCPLLALWGAKGMLERFHDVLACWRERASEVRGRAIDCGHFLAEEAPDETHAELRAFFSG